jgi:tetratricopeptide (TPR) repeat protein
MKRTALCLVALFVLTASAAAADELKWARSLQEAMAMAKERGAMIFICEAVSGEADNDAQIAALADPAFIKAAKNFVCLFANPSPIPGTAKVTIDGREEQTVQGMPGVAMKDALHAWNELRVHYVDLNTSSTGDTKIPFQFVIDGNGKVVAEIVNGTKEGGFGAVPATALVAALNEITKQFGKGLSEDEYVELKEKVEQARKAKESGNLREALTLAEEVLKANDRTSVADGAKEIRDAIVKGGEEQIARADDMVATDPAGAVVMLENVQDLFKGTDLEKAAKKKLSELKRKPEVKAVLAEIKARREAEKAIAKAMDDIAKGEFARGLQALDDVAKAFAGTELGDRAKAAADALRADEEKMAAAQEQAAAKDCKGWLSMARSFARNGMTDKAKAKYQEIIDKFPGTSFAGIAAEELAKLR